MTSNIEYKNYSPAEQAKLFRSFAESLRQPLYQMARTAELSLTTGKTDALPDLLLASTSLERLVDSFVLGLDAANPENVIELTPVSLSAVLSDVAHLLQPQANALSCDIELRIAGKYGPVLAHPEGLQAAMIGLGQALLEARSQQPATKRRVVTLAAHRTRNGISAGMFSDIQGLTAASLRRGQQLAGTAKQPLNQLMSSGGAGVFIAGSLLDNMTSGLRAARYQKMSGLAATFTPSQQLTLVA